MAVVRPDALPKNPLPPPVVLEEALVDRRITDLSSKTDVPAGRHDFELHYTAPSLRDSGSLMFRYRLEGYDPDWIDAGQRRVAYYTHLPPGEYRFRVIAGNEDGVWNESGAELGFSVTPRLHETAWLRALVGLTLCFLIGAGYESRARKINAHNRELEEKVRERTRDLAFAREAAESAAAAKSRFLANMSHEIRTPIAGIQGILEVLATSSLDPQQRRRLRMARSAAKGLQTIIDDILDLSKIEAGKMEIDQIDFDLHRTIEETVAIFKQRARDKGLKLIYRADPDAPDALRGDPVRLRQVLTNLLGNAVKFTERGHVKLIMVDEGKAEDRRRLRFEVHDQGIGIAPEAQSRLFQAFSQADGSSQNYGGTGLGLAICKQLVELMDGEIGVESTLGEGSKFWFTVILAAGKAPEGYAETGLHITATEQFRGRILLVEDDPINREVSLAWLDDLGLEADCAENGRRALEALAAGAYDLVLMDCRMPEMDGFEATRAIREKEAARGEARLPIIALTANAMRGDKERCLAAGMDDYLTKPFTPSALDVILERWLRGSEESGSAA